jgi:peptidoglycan/LPS O-acetylase OafA/YrhL
VASSASIEGITVCMEVPEPRASNYYRPELDIVRFFAFLLVFIEHTVPQDTDHRVVAVLGRCAPLFYAAANACSFGLCLFFTLSAFLICELLLRERETLGTVRVKQFYIRRILRIWPLYYLALAIGVAAAFLPGDHRGEIVQMGWFAVFLGDCYGVISEGTSTPMGQMWSISVEEQFYLLVPWIIRFLNRKALYGFCVTLVVVANVWLFYLGKVQATRIRIWMNPFVQFECFAVGVLLCLVLKGRIPRLASWQRVLLLSGSCCCWLYASSKLHIHFSHAYENPGSWSLMGGYALGALGSAMLLAAFLGVDARLLPHWAIYLGRVSYGLYVFHMFAVYITKHLLIGPVASIASPIYFLKGGITLGLTLLMAALSYRYFEKPFLNLKKRHAVVQSHPG